MKKWQNSAEALAGLEYEDVDLNGETMIPAFVDAHGHIDMTDQFAGCFSILWRYQPGSPR